MNLEQLYKDYYAGRSENLRTDEFLYVVAVTPALLIAQADGEIQEAEQAFLDRASKEIAEGFAEDENADLTDLITALKNELTYLVHHLNKWETPFLSALKALLPGMTGFDGLIREMMNETANAHPSPEKLEEKKMNEILTFLGL